MVGHGSRGRGFGQGRGDIGLPREVYQRGAKDKKGQNVYNSKTFSQGDQCQEENLIKIGQFIKKFQTYCALY